MGISLFEALSLDGLKDAKVLAGREGLNRIIRWVHVVDVPNATDWVHGGELLFVTGIGLSKDTESLCKLIEGLAAKNVAGLVINVGPYIHGLPSEALNVAERLAFPVLELPWEVKLVDVTEALCKQIVTKTVQDRAVLDLVDALISGRVTSEEIMVNRAKFYGFDITKGCLVMVVDIDRFKEHLQKKQITDEKTIQLLKTMVQDLAVGVCRRKGAKSLVTAKGDEIIVLLEVQRYGEKDIREMADEIRDCVRAGKLGFTVSVGIGGFCRDLQDIPHSYTEAKRALFVCQRVFGGDATLIYAQTGLYRILFMIPDRAELENYFQSTLGRLVESDPNLLQTLDAYLEHNGSLQKTAQQLFIHKNTLRYRLCRIEKLTGLDLDSAHNRLALAAALAVGKFLQLT